MPMGAMSMDLKPPLGGGLGGPHEPNPPPPSGNAKKKRRTSSAANAQPTSQPPPLPQVQDLLPPPLTGKTCQYNRISFHLDPTFCCFVFNQTKHLVPDVTLRMLSYFFQVMVILLLHPIHLMIHLRHQAWV